MKKPSALSGNREQSEIGRRKERGQNQGSDEKESLGAGELNCLPYQRITCLAGRMSHLITGSRNAACTSRSRETITTLRTSSGICQY